MRTSHRKNSNQGNANGGVGEKSRAKFQRQRTSRTERPRTLPCLAMSVGLLQSGSLGKLFLKEDYNPSHPFARPFAEVMTPFQTGRGGHVGSMLASRFCLEKGQPRQARLKFGTWINDTSPLDGRMSGWLGAFDFFQAWRRPKDLFWSSMGA